MKFFRKIRQQLLAKDQFRKYLLYALGEIVLVVLGILIALAINNGQENRMLRKKEQTYLRGLHSEFETSQRKLEELIAVNQRNYAGAKQIITYLSDTLNTPTEQAFAELLLQTFSLDISFNPNNSLLQEMINSGSIKDLSNPELRLQLTTWLATLEDVARQEADQERQREEMVNLFQREAYSIRTIFDLAGVSQELGIPLAAQRRSNLPLLKSVAFENQLLTFMLTSAATEEAHYQPLLADLQTILRLIQADIE
jgi:hypothetical protein